MELSDDGTVLVTVTNQDLNTNGTFTIPKSVTSIGRGAFYSCTSLTQLGIPKSVTSIGNAAFEGCTSLLNIIIEGEDDNIKKLLPDELQKLVVSPADYKKILAIQNTALERIIHTIGSSVFHHLSNDYQDVLSIIDSYVGNNAYINQAQQRMKDVIIPTDDNWQGYEKQINGIANAFIEQAKSDKGRHHDKLKEKQIDLPVSSEVKEGTEKKRVTECSFPQFMGNLISENNKLKQSDGGSEHKKESNQCVSREPGSTVSTNSNLMFAGSSGSSSSSGSSRASSRSALSAKEEAPFCCIIS